MYESKQITKQANDLTKHESFSWLAKELGIDHRTLKKRIDFHTWLLSEAETITKHHQNLITNLKTH